MASSLNLKTLREKHRHVYLVIYPETDADVKGYYCGGGLDLGLTERGMEEARKTARRFQKNPLKIKKIYASPELRAVQMADFLHDEIHGKLHLLRAFADQNLGALEGQIFVYPDTEWSEIDSPLSGENGENFSLRIRSALETFLEEELVCVLVTHPRVALKILAWLGVGKKTLERGKIYSIDLPADQGAARLREV